MVAGWKEGEPFDRGSSPGRPDRGKGPLRGRRHVPILPAYPSLFPAHRTSRFAMVPGSRNPDLTIVQMFNLGVESLPLVAVIAIFLGSETVIQAVYQMAGIVPMRYLGVLVCKSLTTELGPVITSMVVAGRVATGIAAEIGTMKQPNSSTLCGYSGSILSVTSSFPSWSPASSWCRFCDRRGVSRIFRIHCHSGALVDLPCSPTRAA